MRYGNGRSRRLAVLRFIHSIRTFALHFSIKCATTMNGAKGASKTGAEPPRRERMHRGMHQQHLHSLRFRVVSYSCCDALDRRGSSQ